MYDFASMNNVNDNFGSTLKGKNLLQGEQILFFKSRPILRMEAKMKMTRVAFPESVAVCKYFL